MSEPVEPGEKRARLYDLAEKRVVVDNSIPAKDPIDRFLDSEDERLVRTAKRLQLKTIIKDYEKELGANEPEQVETEMPRETVSIPPQLVTELAKMSDEEREKAVEVYQRLAMVQNTKDLPPMYWPLIMGATHSNPTSSTSEVATVAEKMANMMQTGMNIANARGQQPNYDPLALMKFASDLAKPQVPAGPMGPMTSPLDDAMKMIDFFEQKGLLKKPSEGPAPQTSDAMVQIELEKIRQQGEDRRSDYNLKIKEIDMKYGLESRKLDVEKAKNDVFGEGLAKVARAAGHAFGEGEEEGQTAAGAMRLSPQAVQTSPQVTYLPCEVCRTTKDPGLLAKIGGKNVDTQIPVPNPSVARDVTCPLCGSIYGYTPVRA